jgi:hypothetical protein
MQRAVSMVALRPGDGGRLSSCRVQRSGRVRFFNALVRHPVFHDEKTLKKKPRNAGLFAANT